MANKKYLYFGQLLKFDKCMWVHVHLKTAVLNRKINSSFLDGFLCFVLRADVNQIPFGFCFFYIKDVHV